MSVVCGDKGGIKSDSSLTAFGYLNLSNEHLTEETLVRIGTRALYVSRTCCDKKWCKTSATEFIFI